METTVRVGALSGLAAFVEARGGSFAQVLAEAGLEQNDLADVDRLLPVTRHAGVLNAAARQLDDDVFGLHFGLSRELSGLGVLAYALRNAPTVGAAMQNTDRFSGFQMQRGRMRFDARGVRPIIRFEISPTDYELLRHYTESTAVMGLRFMRSVLGQDWRPQRLRFGHREPRSVDEYVKLFQSPLEFEQGVHFEVTLTHGDLEREVAGADPTLLRVVESHLRLKLAGEPALGWVGEVRAAIAKTLTNGEASVQALSKQLGVSARTLQRRLGEHHTSFQYLVSDVRRELADQYLGSSEISLSEVAFLLGYSDLSSFHRAFRRWSGKTPLEQRKSLISSPPS